MLQTIEVQIDYNGAIYPVESATKLPAGRALLTLMGNTSLISQPAKKNHFDDLFGILKASHGVSLDEMEQAIAENLAKVKL